VTLRTANPRAYVYRDGVTFDVRVNSSDRAKFLKVPKLH
jgi:hypothetical protein